MPQVCKDAAVKLVKVPLGAFSWPSGFEPQHATVSSVLIPHTCLSPATMLLNFTAGTLPTPHSSKPQHTTSWSLLSAHVNDWPAASCSVVFSQPSPKVPGGQSHTAAAPICTECPPFLQVTGAGLP